MCVTAGFIIFCRGEFCIQLTARARARVHTHSSICMQSERGFANRASERTYACAHLGDCPVYARVCGREPHRLTATLGLLIVHNELLAQRGVPGLTLRTMSSVARPTNHMSRTVSLLIQTLGSMGSW